MRTIIPGVNWQKMICHLLPSNLHSYKNTKYSSITDYAGEIGHKLGFGTVSIFLRFVALNNPHGSDL